MERSLRGHNCQFAKPFRIILLAWIGQNNNQEKLEWDGILYLKYFEEEANKVRSEDQNQWVLRAPVTRVSL